MAGFIKRVMARMVQTKAARRSGHVPWIPDPQQRALLRSGTMPLQPQMQFLVDYVPAGVAANDPQAAYR